MKNVVLSMLWLCSLGTAAAQSELSQTDRELLLDKLKAIQENSNKTVKNRYAVAITAYRGAVDSDSEALALYLKCHEKVNYQEKARKTQDFREWKRRNSDRHDDPGFKRALRHQLAWLLTTIDVAGNSSTKTEKADRATAALDAIFRDAKVLDGYQGELGKPVLTSVYAQAYDLDKLDVGDWPAGPLAISSMYESLILPPLRNPQSISKLKAAWSARIKHEGMIHQVWGREGSAGRDRVPAFEQWMAKGRLNLVWNMETDLFSSGDEKAASLRMLEHLKENISHNSAPQWISEFTNLLNGHPAAGLEPEEQES